MMNKAINHVVTIMIDSLTKFKNKLAYYLAIFAMVFGSTFGTMNSANAVALTNGGATAAGQLNGNAVTTAANAVTHTIDLDDANITVTSFTGNQTSANVVTINDTHASADGIFTVSGNVVSDEDIKFLSGNFATTFVFGGAVTGTGNGANGLLVNLDGNAITTFTGVDKNVDMLVDGIADGEGTMNVSAASGTITFDGTMGATKELKALNVSSGAIFKAAADIEAVAITAATTFEAALKADTISVTDSILTLNALTVDTDADSQTLVLTLNDTSGTGQVTFANGAAVAHTGTIVAQAQGEGKILVAVGAGAAADEQTFTGAIGLTGARIGEIAVGTTALSGVADFEGVVFTEALSIVGGDHVDEDSIIDLGANLTATTGITMTTAGAGASTLKVTANATVAGAVQGSGAGVGLTLLDIDADVTFANDVGTSTAIDALAQITSKTTTFQGDVGITTITLTDAGAVTFDKAGAQTFTGAIAAADVQEGTVTNGNNSGEVTFDGAIGTAARRVLEITAIDGATTKLNNTFFTKTLDLDTNGETTTIEAAGNFIGTLSGNAGALEIVAGAVIELGSAIGSGSTVFDTQTVTANGSGVVIAGDITVKPSAQFTSGTIVLIQGDSAEVSSAEKLDILLQDTALTDYTVDDGGGTATHDIGITATAKSSSATATELGLTKNSGAAAHQAMASITAAADSTVLTFINNSLGQINGKTNADATILLKQTEVQTDTIGGSAVATRAMTGTVQGIVSNRMASLRSGDAFVTGMSAGNGMSANSGFIQAFGSESEQKNTITSGATVFGFDSETSGLAIGFDGMTENGSTIGLSASYSTSDVEGKGTGKSKNSIDSYTVSAYADKATGIGYIEGSLTYGINDNASSRIVNSAGVDRTYKGAYDSQQISLKVGGGVPNEVRDGTFVTPFASGTVSQITTDAYTETSTTASDSLRLRIAQEDISSLVGTVGVKAHMITDYGTPTISLSVNNEFGDTSINSVNTYQGGGTAFKTTTDVEELSATLGLGYSFGNDAASLNLNYEANANDDDYLSHYGTVKIIAKF